MVNDELVYIWHASYKITVNQVGGSTIAISFTPYSGQRIQFDVLFIHTDDYAAGVAHTIGWRDTTGVLNVQLYTGSLDNQDIIVPFHDPANAATSNLAYNHIPNFIITGSDYLKFSTGTVDDAKFTQLIIRARTNVAFPPLAAISGSGTLVNTITSTIIR